ncbi:E3 SUMO-protein ligase nse2 [Colletotrichum sp. SAR 10_66]|nr:E3 SUMO-protein ligase nse2 [Colletotrichum sp. SAR 10_66]
MVKQNDVIAIIVIVLFIVLAGVAFGIYRLVHVARQSMSVTSRMSPTKDSSPTMVEAVNHNTAKALDIVDELCKEVNHLERTSRTREKLEPLKYHSGLQAVLLLLHYELHEKLRARTDALHTLAKAQKALDVMICDIDANNFAALMLGDFPSADLHEEGQREVARWAKQSRDIDARMARMERENEGFRRKIGRVAAVIGDPRVIDEALVIDGVKCCLLGRAPGATKEENQKGYDGPKATSLEEVKRALDKANEPFLERQEAYEKSRDSGEKEDEVTGNRDQIPTHELDGRAVETERKCLHDIEGCQLRILVSLYSPKFNPKAYMVCKYDPDDSTAGFIRPAQRRPERQVVDDDDVDLPPYEPLACPLTDQAKRAILELSNSRDVHRYASHIKQSISNLSQSVAEVNDATRDRHEQLRRIATKRAESDSSQEKSQREEQVEAHAAALDAEVPGLTRDVEAALRDLLDRQAQVEDDKKALAETADYFQTLPAAPARARRRRQQNGNEDEEGDTQMEEDEAPPEQSVIDTLRQHRADKAREYQNLNVYQRYALNNDYAGFKKLLHDAVHGDSGPTLPNAKRWFDDEGNPVMPRMAGAAQNVKDEGGAADDEDEDEDLVIAGEIRDYRCPLSMQELKEPFSNRVCNHTYEKQWITEMLNKAPNRRAQCVVAGCSKEFGVDDFYDDNVILRKMKRAQELQRLEEEEGSSSPDEDADEDAPRQVKRERRKRKVEAIDDDDE